MRTRGLVSSHSLFFTGVPSRHAGITCHVLHTVLLQRVGTKIHYCRQKVRNLCPTACGREGLGVPFTVFYRGAVPSSWYNLPCVTYCTTSKGGHQNTLLPAKSKEFVSYSMRTRGLVASHSLFFTGVPSRHAGLTCHVLHTSSKGGHQNTLFPAKGK
jgi:hypothetical protein